MPEPVGGGGGVLYIRQDVLRRYAERRDEAVMCRRGSGLVRAKGHDERGDVGSER